jgi:hypothetical protein
MQQKAAHHERPFAFVCKKECPQQPISTRLSGFDHAGARPDTASHAMASSSNAQVLENVTRHVFS